MTERITFSCPDDLADQLHAELDYGDNRSELIRDLLREALADRDDTDEPTSVETAGESDRGCADYDTVILPDAVPARVRDNEARAAIGATLSYIRKHGAATKADLVENVMPSHACGYDVPESASGWKGSWWRKIVRPALQVDDRVETPQPGGSKYRWVG